MGTLEKRGGKLFQSAKPEEAQDGFFRNNKLRFTSGKITQDLDGPGQRKSPFAYKVTVPVLVKGVGDELGVEGDVRKAVAILHSTHHP